MTTHYCDEQFFLRKKNSTNGVFTLLLLLLFFVFKLVHNLSFESHNMIKKNKQKNYFFQ